MEPRAACDWSHHTHQATIDPQFIVYKVVGATQPEGGWPESAYGAAQGSIVPIESGYYRGTLVQRDEE